MPINHEPEEEEVEAAFIAWDKDPVRNPYIDGLDTDKPYGAYDNADEVETAYKAGYTDAWRTFSKRLAEAEGDE